jgi:hypothetical protein
MLAALRSLPRRIVNLIWYQRWTVCSHGRWPDDWEALGFDDWQCRRCGVTK